jgi:hypothetical protein
MRFWHSIAPKTLVLPGSTILGLFDKTATIIARVPNGENVNFRFIAECYIRIFICSNNFGAHNR